jgi:hypothetical protein
MLTATSVEEPAQIQHNALGPVRVLNFTSTVARTSQTIVSLGVADVGSDAGDGFRLGRPSSPRVWPLSGFVGSWLPLCGLRRRGSPVRFRRHQIGVGREEKGICLLPPVGT